MGLRVRLRAPTAPILMCLGENRWENELPIQTIYGIMAKHQAVWGRSKVICHHLRQSNWGRAQYGTVPETCEESHYKWSDLTSTWVQRPLFKVSVKLFDFKLMKPKPSQTIITPLPCGGPGRWEDPSRDILLEAVPPRWLLHHQTWNTQRTHGDLAPWWTPLLLAQGVTQCLKESWSSRSQYEHGVCPHFNAKPVDTSGSNMVRYLQTCWNKSIWVTGRHLLPKGCCLRVAFAAILWLYNIRPVVELE